MAAKDPTKTTLIRKRFAGEAASRFGEIKAAVRKLVVDDDAFGLKPAPSFMNARQYQFLSSAEQVDAFVKWLQIQIDLGVLQVQQVGDRKGHWSNAYLQAAYKRGIETADQQVKQAGIDVPQQHPAVRIEGPIHADAAEMIYTRTYGELKGVTDVMANQMRRTLTEGLVAGDNPLTIARALNGRVDAIGITRARTIARTEVIRAHAEATLNEFEAFNIEGVELGVEFHTAADPCPECEELADTLGVMTVDESRGIIPVHPNCRCVWLPVVEMPKKGAAANARRVTVAEALAQARARWVAGKLKVA